MKVALTLVLFLATASAIWASEAEGSTAEPPAQRPSYDDDYPVPIDEPFRPHWPEGNHEEPRPENPWQPSRPEDPRDPWSKPNDPWEQRPSEPRDEYPRDPYDEN